MAKPDTPEEVRAPADDTGPVAASGTTGPEAARNTLREEAHTIMDRLVAACERAGLVANRYAPTRVHVSGPKPPHPGLTEVIRLGLGPDEGLYFFWSWGQAICPATEIDTAAARIAYVVIPRTGSRATVPPTGCSGV